MNVDRFVNKRPAAGVLTGVVAYAATDRREGVVFLDDAQGLFVAPLGDQGDVALGALAGRTCVPAGRDSEFLDRKSAGNGLWVELVGSPAVG